MRKLNRQKKTVVENFLIIIIVILNSSNSTTQFANNLVFLFLSTMLLLYKAKKRNVGIITAPFLKISFFFGALFTAYIIKFWQIDPSFFFSTYFRVFLAYVAIKLLGKNGFFYYLKEVVYYAAFISLPLYIFQFINFSLTFNYIKTIQNIFPFLYRDSDRYANIIIWGLKGGGADLRNSGFMWEPGAFAAMLLIPIFIQLLTNNFKFDKRVVVLIIALLTTLSTMGYLGLILILLYYLLNKNVKSLLILLPIGIGGIIYILTLDFMIEKIEHELNNQNKIEQVATSRRRSFGSLGRIGSFNADFNDWKNQPFLGIGGQNEIIATVEGKTINRTNGFSRFFLRYGIIGLAFYFYGLYKTFYNVSSTKKILTSVIVTAIIFTLSFSNELLAKPLFFAFAIMYLIVDEKPLDFSKYSNKIYE